MQRIMITACLGLLLALPAQGVEFLGVELCKGSVETSVNSSVLGTEAHGSAAASGVSRGGAGSGVPSDAAVWLVAAFVGRPGAVATPTWSHGVCEPEAATELCDVSAAAKGSGD